MNEEQEELLHNLKEEFYNKYSELVGTYILKAPAELQYEFMAMLQEKSNVFSCNYRKYLK